MPDAVQPDLFGAPPPVLPPGMRYAEDWLDAADECDLLERIATLPLAPMRYRGYTARRRVLSYGVGDDEDGKPLQPADPLPAWLAPLCARAGAWAGIPPGDFVHALVAEYAPGTPLGWHRDRPQFEDVVGLSLAAEAVLRWRPFPPPDDPRAAVLKVPVAPRSIYLLRGPARWAWQHAVAPTRCLRYSITLRTARRPR